VWFVSFTGVDLSVGLQQIVNATEVPGYSIFEWAPSFSPLTLFKDMKVI
jgi:hypothetical protein